MDLAGKVAFITGGARGLGKAFAEALLQRGAKVSLADIITEQGNATERELNAKYGINTTIFSKCDVTNLDDLRGMAYQISLLVLACYKKTIDTFGHLDIVINNAGISDEVNFERMIDVNLTAVIRSSYMAANIMSKENGGKGGIIINISSAAGLFASPFALAYTGVKHGVVGFSRSMAINVKDVNRFGLRIAALCPSFADTEMGNSTVAQVKQTRPDDITMPNFHESQKTANEGKLNMGIMEVKQVVNGMLELISESNCNGAVLSISPIANKYFFPKKLVNKL